LPASSCYVGTLDTCNLSSLWWSANGAFHDLASLLAPDWREVRDQARGREPDGRSHWGGQMRRAFAQAFDDHWADDSFALRPTVKADKRLLRFSTAPRINPPTTAAPES
jgi:hypothetical protein